MIHFETYAQPSTPLSAAIFGWLDEQGWYSKMEAPVGWDYDNWCYDGLIVISFEDPCKAMIFKLAWADDISEQL